MRSLAGNMLAMKEQWLPIADYEGLYEVSSHGRVRSLDHAVPHRDSFRVMRGRALKIQVSQKYPQVSLSRDGKLRSHRIHRLVAETFLADDQRPDLEVCHNDGDPANNHVDNLRWDYRSANHRDKYSHGTNTHSRVTHCVHGHKFTPANTIESVSDRGYRLRRCKQCRRDRWQRIRAEREAQGELVQSRPWKRSA